MLGMRIALGLLRFDMLAMSGRVLVNRMNMTTGLAFMNTARFAGRDRVHAMSSVSGMRGMRRMDRG